jgi:hypothetical protein
VKLSVTEYEREQLAVARQIVDELNANLAGRGAEFRFAVTFAGESEPEGLLADYLAAAGDEPDI